MSQDVDGYERMQETLALREMLARGNRQIEAGRVQPAPEVLSRLRERILYDHRTDRPRARPCLE